VTRRLRDEFEVADPQRGPAHGAPEPEGAGGDAERPRAARVPPWAAAAAGRFALVGAWILLIVCFGVLKPDTFLTGANFATIFGSQAVLATLALALIIPMTAGDYDLSVAFTLMLSAMITALLNVNEGWPILPAMAAGLLAGTGVGLFNGMVVTYFRIDAIIVTLGTGTFIGGLVLWMSDSNTISGVSNGLVSWVIARHVLGVPIAFYYVVALAAVLWYVFEFTPTGRRLLIVGRGRAVARLSGIHVDRMRVGAFAASGFLSAGAGLLYAGTSGAADPTSGQQLLLPAFAAAFLGATAIMPGRFNPWGTLIAVYFLVTGITGLQLLGVEGFVQELFYGGALVIAVVFSQIARRREALEGSA
jgi:ribose transport system permease protein